MKKITPIEAYGFPITLAFHKGSTYYGERITGRLWEADLNFYDKKQERSQKGRLITTFPVVPLVGHNETGLIGIALDPDFESNGYIYCYYTHGNSEKDFKNRVVRVKKDGTGKKILLDNIPAGIIHNGGILVFGPDGKLYIGTGVDNFNKEKSQNIKFLGGKVLRINKDGGIPSDNPFKNSPVYSYGHRNIFGLAFHPKTGKLYGCDAGPDKADEINIIEPGGNYGWPKVVGFSKDPKFINPVKEYTPVITPVQCVFVGNDFYFGSFNEGSVHKLTFKGENLDKVKKDEVVYKDKPFSLIGVFYHNKKFYATLSSSIIQFKPKTK